MKFKVGDRVKRVRGGSCGDMKEGDFGVIFSMKKADCDGDVFCDIKIDKTGLISNGHYIKSLEPVNKTTLKELPDTAVRVETKEEYDELMQIYENAGWEWCDGDNPVSRHGCGYAFPATLIASNYFNWGSGEYKISLKKFKRMQGLDKKPELYEGLLTTCTSSTSTGSTLTMSDIVDAYRYVYTPAPNPRWYSYDFGFNEVETKKKGIMSYLKDIPNRIKKLLSKDLAAMYKLGWIDEELNLTSTGKDQLNLILQDEYEVKLGSLAQKEVTKLEKETKK